MRPANYKMARIPGMDRTRILQSYEDGEDFVQVAETLGIKRTTAYSIIRNYAMTGRSVPLARGGGRPLLLDRESKDFFVGLIEEDPMITLQSMKERYRVAFPDKPVVHISTISRALDGQLITLKKSHDLPMGRYVVSLCIFI